MQAQINAKAVATEHFLDTKAFAAFLEYEDYADAGKAAEAFQDSYAGTFESLTEWAENFVEEAGLLAEVPDSLRAYFDFQAWARDADLNGDIWTADFESGDLAVFWRR